MQSVSFDGAQSGGAHFDTDTYLFTFDFVTNQFGPPTPGHADLQYDPFRIYGYIQLTPVYWDYLFVDGFSLGGFPIYVGIESTTSSFARGIAPAGPSRLVGLPDYGLFAHVEYGAGWEGYPLDFDLNLSFSRLPEPASIALLGLAFPLGLGVARRRFIHRNDQDAVGGAR
jgi:hypothetical protein